MCGGGVLIGDRNCEVPLITRFTLLESGAVATVPKEREVDIKRIVCRVLHPLSFPNEIKLKISRGWGVTRVLPFMS